MSNSPQEAAALPKTPLWYWLLCVTVVVLCCGGAVAVVRWNSELSKDPLADLGTPLPAVASHPLPTPSWPEPSRGTDFDKSLRYELEKAVLVGAAVPATVSSRCEPQFPKFNRPDKFHCMVTYGSGGHTATFAVETRMGPPIADGTLNLIQYDVRGVEQVITRVGVHRLVQSRFGKVGAVRCDELPEVQVVPAGQLLPQSCYLLRERTKTRRLTLKASDKVPDALNPLYIEEHV
jgi:hypothetical protein